MRRLALSCLFVLGLLLAAGRCPAEVPAAPPGQWRSIFNGRDLTGWTPKIRGYPAGENFADTFRVADGMIQVRYDGYEQFDERFGHLFYETSFTDYRIRFEYRFVGEQCTGGPGWAIRNSGLMAHGQTPESMAIDQEFPVSLEMQILGGDGEHPRHTGNLCTPGTHVVMEGKLHTPHCQNSTSDTFHGDQWVTAEFEAHGDGTIRHFINGKLVLEYEKPQYDPKDGTAKPLIEAAGGRLALTGGTISLQSESHPVDFRNIEVMDLSQPAVPAEEAAILDRIEPPSFPDRDFSVTDFGAAPGQDCSAAIAKAIAACHEAGGGRVVIPAGDWLTGPIHLKSSVNLHVSRGATLVFDPDPARYLPVVTTHWEGMECRNYSPLVYAADATDIAITGGGTLDGSATWDTWWAWVSRDDRAAKRPVKQKADRDALVAMVAAGTPPAERIFGAGHFLRPNFIQPYRCTNVLIEGITLIRSPMWEVHPVRCTNVTVRGVTARTLGPNNDGCNPECCRDVLIEDCLFETGDDCIAIKSGRNDDGRRIGIPSENIVVRDCSFKDGHGGVTLGSEIAGGVRNVFVSNCRMDSPELDRAFRFKSNAVRGGVLENINVRDVEIGQVGGEVLGVEFDYEEGAKGPHHPVLRGVTIERVTSEQSGKVFSIRTIPASTVSGIVVRNCVFRGATAPPDIRGGELSLENVRIEAAR